MDKPHFHRVRPRDKPSRNSRHLPGVRTGKFGFTGNKYPQEKKRQQ
jgi:hypothetical protein